VSDSPRPSLSGLTRVAGLAAVLRLAAGWPGVSAQPGPMTLVVCAPGYPGSTVEAQ